MNLKTIETELTAALKNGKNDRRDVLRLFLNQIKLIAKNDKNREVTDDDIIAARNRIIKQARETLSYIKYDDFKAVPLMYEISVIEEFLPKKMSPTQLSDLIAELLVSAPEGKAARGFVMKELNSTYRGQFESREANEILVTLGK